MFRLLGQHLGIKEPTARAVAFYITQTYDLNNATELWEGFKDCLYLTPIERRVWWKTWVARNQLPVDEATLKQVSQETQSRSGNSKDTPIAVVSKPRAGSLEPHYLVDSDTGQMHRVDPESEDYPEAESFWKARTRSHDIQRNALQAQHGKGRKFYVIGSQVYPVGEGEEGFSYAEAAAQAQANWDKEMERERQAMNRLLGFGSGDQRGVVSSLVTALVKRRDRGY